MPNIYEERVVFFEGSRKRTEDQNAFQLSEKRTHRERETQRERTKTKWRASDHPYTILHLPVVRSGWKCASGGEDVRGVDLPLLIVQRAPVVALYRPWVGRDGPVVIRDQVGCRQRTCLLHWLGVLGWPSNSGHLRRSPFAGKMGRETERKMSVNTVSVVVSALC